MANKLEGQKEEFNEEFRQCDPEEALTKLIEGLNIYSIPDEASVYLFEVNNVPAVCTGSVTLVTGKEKSGKSNFVGVLMAAAMSTGKEALQGYVRALKKDMSILYIDTEQPVKDARKTLQRVCLTAGYDRKEDWTKHGIIALTLRNGKKIKNGLRDVRGVANDECVARKEIIEGAVDHYRPDLVVIDGIADLLWNINDIVEVNDIIDWIEFLTEKHNCAVMTVLHEKGESSKAMGWLGTRLQQKMSDRFYIKKLQEPPRFHVAKMSRGIDMNDLDFVISSDRWELYDPQKALDDINKTIESKRKEKAAAFRLMFSQALSDGAMKTNALMAWLYNNSMFRDPIKKYTKINTQEGCRSIITEAETMGIIHSPVKKNGQSKEWLLGSEDPGNQTEINI